MTQVDVILAGVAATFAFVVTSALLGLRRDHRAT